MRRSVWTWCLAAAVLAMVAAAGGAAAIRDDETPTTARFAQIDPTLLESVGPHGTFVPAILSNRLVSVVLQFNGDPVGAQDAAAKQNGQKLSPDEKAAIRAQLKAQQDNAKGGIAAAGAQIVGDMQDAYNGVQVLVPEKNIAQLASLPGVVAVHAVQSFTPSNVNGVPFVGGPQAWGNFHVTGKGVKLAVIDTGIDYTHADFGGSGNPADFRAAAANSTAPANPAFFGPAAPKVKGGFDFVGDSYNADPTSPSFQPHPHPDPNPLDCNGHGTHTAGTAAGFGVLSDGSTFHGPYDASTVSGHSWKVGPGVAPGADIYAYRVFGCKGSSDVVAEAINQAMVDGVNVISMSLGSPFGRPDDPTSVASQTAVNDGIAVIAAAGNNGGNAYVTGAPAAASGVLSVAALDGSVPTYPGGHFALSTGTSLDAINANNATFTDGTTLPVVVVHDPSQPGGVSLGCSVAAFQAANVAGKLAVVQRGVCARVAKAIYGRDAGAAAVAMINNTSGFPPFEGDITSNPDTGQPVPKVTIPFFGISGTVTGTDGSHLIAADGGTVVLTNTTVPNSGYKVVASFSSGGPRNPDSAPKPEVIAPGVSVASAGIGTGTGAAVESGTSMATPMTAGIAALVREAHPTWAGAQIKAAIMNTADPSLNKSYNVRRAGTGVVQAQNAVNSSVLATTSDGLDSIAFGFVPGSGDYSASKTFTLTNYGSSTATYNLSVSPNSGLLGSSIGVTPSSVAVAAGGTATVQATFSMSTAAFAALPSDDTFSIAIGPGGVLNVRGDILAKPAAGSPSDDQTLRLPYIVVPRGLSNVTAGTPGPFTASAPPAPGQTPPMLPPGQTFTSTLPLSNSGIHSGTADLYAWGIHDPQNDDPQENGGPADVRDVGVQVQPGAAFGSTDSDRGLVFLINTWGQATNQTVTEYDIPIDTDGDGVPDFVVVGADLGAVTTGSFNGVMASFTFNASTGALVGRPFVADAPMNGSTVELPTLASDLGSSAKNGFTYAVDAFSLVPGSFVDATSSAMFAPFKPAVSSGDFATLDPGASSSFPLTVDKQQLKKDGTLGWLVASVDNANGAAQASEVQAPAP